MAFLRFKYQLLSLVISNFCFSQNYSKYYTLIDSAYLFNIRGENLKSDSLYNLAFNYTEERQYPPKASTTVSPETSITLLGDLVYYEKLYLNTNSISYGSGFYEVYSSSTYGTNNQKSKLFNYITTVESTYLLVAFTKVPAFAVVNVSILFGIIILPI